jgi:hypothetical protein
VRPGVRLAYASLDLRASALMALDFPAFDRPANAISRGPAGGDRRTLAAPVRNEIAPSSGPRTRVAGPFAGRPAGVRYNSVFFSSATIAPFAASCAPPARGCGDVLAFGASQMIRTWRLRSLPRL